MNLRSLWPLQRSAPARHDFRLGARSQPESRGLDITFHGLWVFYREANQITAFAFTDPGKEHCYVGGSLVNGVPQLQCLPPSSVAFANLTQISNVANRPKFNDSQNIELKCSQTPTQLLSKARAMVYLPQWPSNIQSLRQATMLDVMGSQVKGSMVQRFSYSFGPDDPDPYIFATGFSWNPSWLNGNANIHFYAEPDHRVPVDHAFEAMNDVAQAILGQSTMSFKWDSQYVQPPAAPADQEGLDELSVKCP